jgi:uncharacterized coiled-coil DUF342 family protein
MMEKTIKHLKDKVEKNTELYWEYLSKRDEIDSQIEHLKTKRDSYEKSALECDKTRNFYQEMLDELV